MQVEKKKNRYTIENLTTLLGALVEENFDWGKYYLVNLHDRTVYSLAEAEIRTVIEEMKTDESFVVRDERE